MPDVLVPLLSLGVGALLGGVSQALVSRYATFKESKGMAEALDAEITAILRVIDQREYLRHLGEIVERLQDPTYEFSHDEVFGIRITQNYLQVFDSLCPKIGLLGSVSGRIVGWYIVGKSLLEDLAELKETRDMVLDNTRVLSREGLLAITQGIIFHFQLIQQEGNITIHELRKYQRRRWLGIFP